MTFSTHFIGLYNGEDSMNQECLRFCFLPVLQDELYEIASYWNTHSIRPVNTAETPAGRPDQLYFMPHIQANQDFKCGFEELDVTLEAAEELYCYRESEWGCSAEFQELASILMFEEDLSMPRSAQEAEDLYVRLLLLIEALH